eukprot:Skav217830  [mRNA]  locus=scaffold889:516529:518169:+ [translate_table: standard]
MATPAGPPQIFSPAAPSTSSRRARSNVAKELHPWLDPIDLRVPGGKRWLAPACGNDISAQARREVKQLLERKCLESWDLWGPLGTCGTGSGEACPICTLGECGDVSCPAYRPKHPEVREAVEATVLRHAV